MHMFIHTSIHVWSCRCVCVCAVRSDLVGLHPAAGLLQVIKLDEGESSALTWRHSRRRATMTEQQQRSEGLVFSYPERRREKDREWWIEV